MYNILFGGRRKKFEVNCAESTYKVHYLGNVMTSLLKRGGGVGAGSGGGGGDTLTKSTSRKVAETKSNSSSISSAKSARLNSISEEDDDDDEPDDELVDYLECLGAGGVRQDEQLELSCVDKPVRILWDNHLKNSGYYYHYVIIISFIYNKINKYILFFYSVNSILILDILIFLVLHKKKCIGN